MKESTRVPCQKCSTKGKMNFMEKQLWGKGNGQHYRLTCSNPKCSFVVPEINQSSIELLESKGWVK